MTHLTLALPELQRQLDPLPPWRGPFQDVCRRLTSHFGRVETKQLAVDYCQGLLSPVERKNGWQLAEHLGQVTPYRLQPLLDRAVWEADAVREELRRYVIEHLGSAQGVLVLDETGFLKKGIHSVGVKRQYSGTAGRVENCQIGVFLTYAAPQGHTFLDRALYLPQECGPMMPSAGSKPVCPRTSCLRPSPNWPRRCSNARWTPAFLPPG